MFRVQHVLPLGLRSINRFNQSIPDKVLSTNYRRLQCLSSNADQTTDSPVSSADVMQPFICPSVGDSSVRGGFSLSNPVSSDGISADVSGLHMSEQNRSALGGMMGKESKKQEQAQAHAGTAVVQGEKGVWFSKHPSKQTQTFGVKNLYVFVREIPLCVLRQFVQSRPFDIPRLLGGTWTVFYVPSAAGNSQMAFFFASIS